MSKVKTSKGAVWEGFRAWHVCKTQHARSQMTEVSVEVNCHKWPIMGYTRSWTLEWCIETMLTVSSSPSLPNPHVVCRQLHAICFPHYLWAWNRLYQMGFSIFCQLGKKLEKIGVPIYCWHTLIVWLMGLSISELVDKWTLKKWITGFVAGPSGSSVVQHYPWGKSISSRSVLDNPTALSTE